MKPEHSSTVDRRGAPWHRTPGGVVGCTTAPGSTLRWSRRRASACHCSGTRNRVLIPGGAMNKQTLLAPLAAVLLLAGLFEGNVATHSSDATISDWLARTGNAGWIVHALAEVVGGILILAYAQVLRSRLGGRGRRHLAHSRSPGHPGRNARGGRRRVLRRGSDRSGLRALAPPVPSSYRYLMAASASILVIFVSVPAAAFAGTARAGADAWQRAPLARLRRPRPGGVDADLRFRRALDGLRAVALRQRHRAGRQPAGEAGGRGPRGGPLTCGRQGSSSRGGGEGSGAPYARCSTTTPAACAVSGATSDPEDTDGEGGHEGRQCSLPVPASHDPHAVSIERCGCPRLGQARPVSHAVSVRPAAPGRTATPRRPGSGRRRRTGSPTGPASARQHVATSTRTTAMSTVDRDHL